jgi:hypothetical protein
MALNGTMVKIDTVTVGSGGAASIDFQNIPATYTDLKVVLSARGNLASVYTYALIEFNGLSTNLSSRFISGEGSGSPYSATYGSNIALFVNGTSTTSSTFGNAEIYIPNYASTTQNKSVSIDCVVENNATFGSDNLFAGLWSNTSAINRLTIHAANASFVKNQTFDQHSTATLYGISRTTAQIKATGGMVYDTDSHVYHLFNTSGVFTPTQALTVEYLVIAGGGGGGYDRGGGAGAGGYRSSVTGESSGGGASAESPLNLLASTNYTVTIGAGGTAGTGYSSLPTNGSNSVFSSITSTGGGRGGNGDGTAPAIGGSGGGGFQSQAGAAGTTGQGYAGGAANATNSNTGGGGGAGAVGGGANLTTGHGNPGGSGVASSITGSSVTRAGGGGGGAWRDFNSSAPGGAGGAGGGGAGGSGSGGAGGSGLVNTGGGGGGGSNQVQGNGGAGGSGVVIVRYAK